jgi:hypothetical protein
VAKILVGAIQDVAVNQCGVPPKEVQARILMNSIAPSQGEGSSLALDRGKNIVNYE